jgi:outer membrane receptor protein involved in Fe transport
MLLGAAMLAATGDAVAQDESAAEVVVVTGSRIPQTGLSSASPVLVINRQEIEFEGTTDVSTLVNQLPSVFADQTNAQSATATGTSNIDLRGLGAKRSLVLVNGTRLMPADVSSPVADVNQIPAALVDHIEVLTGGGASTVYGSDAMAGVVNFIMRKDFSGIELDGTLSIENADNNNSADRARIAVAGYQQAPENVWDGFTSDAMLLMGANSDNGKANVSVYLGRREIQPVLESARDFSACSLITTFAKFDPSHPADTGLTCGGSSNYDRFLSVDDAVNGLPFNFFEEGTGVPGSGHFVPFTGGPNQEYNFAPLNYLWRPDTRYTGGFFAHYQRTRQLDLTSSFMFTDDDTVAQIAPSGLFFGAGAANGFDEVNCGNPLMTQQERTLLCGADGSGANNLVPGQATLLIGRRNLEGGDRQTELRHVSYRMQIGARGELGQGWSYNANAQYGFTHYSQILNNELSISRVQNALEVDPATGRCFAAEPNAEGIIADPHCVPMDIFNGFGTVTPAALHYVGAEGLQDGISREQIVSGSLTGDLGAWGGRSPWAKSPVAVSLGAEWRADALSLDTSAEFQNNDLSGAGGPTLPVPLVEINSTEGFLETKIPLLQEKRWFEDLSLNAGYRYASYSVAGAASDYKYGAEWQPIGDFRLRASYERAVRAPNVLELFAPATITGLGNDDPCVFSTSGQCANVKNAGTQILECPESSCNARSSGNAALKTETGHTRTAGIVLTPQFLDGFTATIDYFDIHVSGYIDSIDPNLVLLECYGHRATAQSIAFYCPFVHRNAQGQLFGDGFVSAETTNKGFLGTKGVDIEADYTHSLDDWGLAGLGTLDLNLVGTLLNELTVEPFAGSGFIGTYDCAGLYGIVCGGPAPRWRHKFRLTWSPPGDVRLSLAWRHFGPVRFDADTSNHLLNGITNPLLHGMCRGACGDIPDGVLNSADYFDLAAEWAVREGIELRAGVNNVFDREMPVDDNNFVSIGSSILGNGNGFAGSYDALGRTLFVSATIKY